LFDVTAIGSPPVGAALEIVMVPVAPVPPTREVGLTVRLVTVGAVTVRFELTVVWANVALIATTAFAVIPFDVAVKFAESVPAATVTEAGTVAAAVLFDARLMTMPPAVAAPVNVTVPADVAPPNTVVGLSVTAEGIGERIDNAIGPWFTPKAEAFRFAICLLVTGVAVMAKVPDVCPEGTDIVVFETTALSDVVATEKPAGGAAALIVQVPVMVPPP